MTIIIFHSLYICDGDPFLHHSTSPSTYSIHIILSTHDEVISTYDAFPTNYITVIHV